MRKYTFLDRIKLPDDAKKYIESGIFFPQNTEKAPEIQPTCNIHSLQYRADQSNIRLPKELPYSLVKDAKKLKSFAYLIRLKGLYYSSTIINHKSRQAEIANFLGIGLSTWYKILAGWKAAGLVKTSKHLEFTNFTNIYKHYEINELHAKGQRVPNDTNIIKRLKLINLRLNIEKQKRKFSIKLAITDRCNSLAQLGGTSIKKQILPALKEITQDVENKYSTKRKYKKAVLHHGHDIGIQAYWIGVNMAAWQHGDMAINNALFTLSCTQAGNHIGRSASTASRLLNSAAAVGLVDIQPTIIQCNQAAYYSRYYSNATPGVWSYKKKTGETIYFRKLANRLTFN